MRRIIMTILAAAALLVPGIRAVSAVQQRPTPTVPHAVVTGDTLWGIARERWPEEDPRKGVHLLLELNHLRSPSLIPGQTIQLPAR